MLAFAKWASAVLEPLLLAVLVAVIVLPVTRSPRLPRAAGVALALLLPMVAVLTLGWLFSVALDDLFTAIPDYVAAGAAAQADLVAWLTHRGLRSVAAVVADVGSNATSRQLVTGTVSTLADLLFQGALVGMVAGFLVVEARDIQAKLDLFEPGSRRRAQRLVRKLARVQQYMLIKTGLSAATGIATAGLCLALGVPNALLLGLIAFVLNYVPNLGCVMAAVPAIGIAWLSGGLGTAALVTTGYVAIHLAIGAILETKLTGDAMGLSAVVVLVSMIFWAWVLGPVGAIVSVPLTLMVRVLLSSSPEWRWLAILLGSMAEARSELDRDSIAALAKVPTEVAK